jgi:hypothetical protein
MMMIVKMRIVLLLVIIHVLCVLYVLCVLCDKLPPFLFVCVKWCNLWRKTTRRKKSFGASLSKLKKSSHPAKSPTGAVKN